MTATTDPRAQLQEEVARRLRPVCHGIPDAEFHALVARIVDVELSHRGLATAGASRADGDGATGTGGA